MCHGFIGIRIPWSSKTLCQVKFVYLSTSTLFFQNVFVDINYNQRKQQLMQPNHLVKDLEFVIKSHQNHDVP